MKGVTFGTIYTSIYNMRNELKLLIAFLKQNNAYSNYRHNVRRDTFFHFNKSYINPYPLILLSFDWFSAREYFYYWEKLDNKWRKYYDNQKEYKTS